MDTEATVWGRGMMVLYDLLALSGVIGFSLMGMQRGLLDQILKVVPIWGTLLLIIISQPLWQDLLAPMVDRSYRSTLSLGVAAVASYPVVLGVARFLTWRLHSTPLGWINRFGGGIMGMAQGVFWVVLVVFALWLTPVSEEKGFQESIIAKKIYPFVQTASTKYIWVALKSQPYSWVDALKKKLTL